MRTPQWIKKLGGHAGELYVAAELSKRDIPNALLPENFSDDDILVGKKGGKLLGYIQVKSCHPDRASSFILRATDEKWENADDNQFVVFVWLGSPKKNESPRYWIARKKEVGEACRRHSAHGTANWERRFYPELLIPNGKMIGIFLKIIDHKISFTLDMLGAIPQNGERTGPWQKTRYAGWR